MSAPETPDFSAASCPTPLSHYPTVQLAHGGGGRLSQSLVEGMFLKAFDNPELRRMHDGALLGPQEGQLAFATDSYVVRPLFFPGGDIGCLAVNGTLNDIAMCGARPVALAVGFIIEEGLAMDELWRVVLSMRRAAEDAGVPIVTGDTKVVDRGKGDKLYVNTTGIGRVPEGRQVDPVRARPGDKVILSGEVAAHGIAIMSVREGLEFESTIESDTACLSPMVEALFDEVGSAVHVLRDPTRGGVASALNELAKAAGVGFMLNELAIPIDEQVRAGCELLGFDPLYVANEGKCLAIVAAEAAEAALGVWRAHPLGHRAAIIGEVTDAARPVVHLRSRIGGVRVVDMLSGEQLPRIC